ncbi:hypothetical protein [Demequina lignilytica]|uniref:Uncharacterized protein n=1 Tax=Demequina lignilytica TaxID=3051663 RepID=A0AAW7M1R8_9MICO|nr:MULTISPECIES: hypothetical protein [unclassified Demequina]MDN4482102.1 hypothetical protein [Demequina sp. SYSU T0a273]MDN4486760.1 hypothetical protein [Demequina sp. SYSU T00039]MDN4489444.1 hypothetical protein [Demequina sp. SYSU T00068]
MSREQTLLQAAIDTTGDATIEDVAEFMPQEVADDAVMSGWEDRRARHVTSPHTPAARALGEDLAHDRTELPPHVCLAVSPTEVHVLGIPHGFWSAHPREAYLMGTFARQDLEVTVKGRLTDRLVTVDDRASGAHLTLVADRISAYHPRTLLELLRMGPDDQSSPG